MKHNAILSAEKGYLRVVNGCYSILMLCDENE